MLNEVILINVVQKVVTFLNNELPFILLYIAIKLDPVVSSHNFFNCDTDRFFVSSEIIFCYAALQDWRQKTGDFFPLIIAKEFQVMTIVAFLRTAMVKGNSLKSILTAILISK